MTTATATTKVWAASEIEEKLKTSVKWLERSVIVLSDGIGFDHEDANYLNYVARWLKGGKNLSGGHIEKVRGMMLKYAGELATIANNKAEAVAAPVAEVKVEVAEEIAVTVAQVQEQVKEVANSTKKTDRSRSKKYKGHVDFSDADPAKYTLPEDPIWNEAVTPYKPCRWF